MSPPIVVVGAGHNGLIAGCYLARAGRDVLVLDARAGAGGGSRTEETVPGYRFDMHSVAHNMINMTAIPDELDLSGAGLVYEEMNPFSIAVRADGRRVRFFRSVEETVASIAEEDRAEADAYRAFCAKAAPIVDAIMPAVRGEVSWRNDARRAASVLRALRGGALSTLRDVLGPYGSLLERWLVSDLTRGPVAAFAAHASVGPDAPGSALFAFWQAAYDPPLGGTAGADLSATRRSNVVQALVHVAASRLPPYPNCRPGDWNGLQSFVDRLDDLATAWAQAEAGLLPDPLPLYAFTTSAIDDTLAPPGHHTAYLACPAAPARVEGGWASQQHRFVEQALDVVDMRAPAFRDSIAGVATWTPDRMESLERWPGGHPMHVDITLDQLGPLRPTRALGRSRTPIAGLYVSGAGTNPSGGILGTPGRAAARAVLRDDP